MTADHGMAFPSPVSNAEENLEGLEKSHKAGVRYRIPRFLRFEVTSPPAGEEPKKGWRKAKTDPEDGPKPRASRWV